MSPRSMKSKAWHEPGWVSPERFQPAWLSNFPCCCFKVTTCLDGVHPPGKQGLILKSESPQASPGHEAREGDCGNNGFQMLQNQILL